MPSRILLVRHGQTDWSLVDRFTGSSDVPLNQTGRAQAQALARRLAAVQASSPDAASAEPDVLVRGQQKQITAVYSSPLGRCLETARCLAEPLHLPLEVIPELRELDYGLWEGMQRDEVLERFAREFEIWRNDPALYAPPKGETGLSLIARVRPAMDRLVVAHPAETLIVVAHKTVNRLLICSLLNIPLKHYRHIIGQDVACLNIIDFVSSDVVSLVKLNDTCHYELN